VGVPIIHLIAPTDAFGDGNGTEVAFGGLFQYMAVVQADFRDDGFDDAGGGA
jgi:hypothetical protein